MRNRGLNGLARVNPVQRFVKAITDWLVFLRVLVRIALLLDQAKMDFWGGVAQLGEHFHGMEGVVGSIPIASTNF